VYHLEGIILEGIIQKLVILRVCEFMREAQQRFFSEKSRHGRKDGGREILR
jgi:hypothetical protein